MDQLQRQLDSGKSYSLEEALDILTRSPPRDGGHSPNIPVDFRVNQGGDKVEISDDSFASNDEKPPSDDDVVVAKSLDDLYNLCEVALDETNNFDPYRDVLISTDVLTSTDDLGNDETE